MGYWQRENIREAVSMNTAGTYKLELPKHGFLGSLLLEINATCGGAYGYSGGAWTIADKIDKIEIIGNGSTVIKSLTGKQLQALAAFDQGVTPPSVLRNYGANVQYDYFLINFGRFLFDPEMYLDLERFDNVELWVTNSGAAATVTTFLIKVTAFWQRETSKAGYLGYMRSESWKQWTTVTDEWIYNVLPTELLIRRILLQSIPAVNADYINDCNIEDLMYDIKLALNTGALLMFDGSLRDLYFENYLDFGKMVLRPGYSYSDTDKGNDVGVGNVLGGAACAASAGATAGLDRTLQLNYNRPTQWVNEHGGDVGSIFLFAGAAFHNCALIRYDQDLTPLTWLNPDLRKSVNLDIHTRNSASADAGVNHIVLDRLVKP